MIFTLQNLPLAFHLNSLFYNATGFQGERYECVGHRDGGIFHSFGSWAVGVCPFC